MSRYISFYPKAVLVPKDTPSPHWAPEGATYVEIVDEGGGPFLEITQLDANDHEQKLRFDFEEFEALYALVSTLLQK
jgi:hypothetical protein